MRQPHRLKTYLLAFALVLTVPMLVGTGLAVWRFVGSERLRLMSMATDAGQDIGVRVDREISTRAAVLQGLAVAPAIYDDLGVFSREARRLAEATGVHIVLFDVTGQQLVNTRVSEEFRLPMTSDPDLVREVVERRKVVYTANLFFGQVARTKQVQVAVPVMRDGNVYRILGASIPSSELISLISEDLKRPIYATLLDRDGTVMARSEEYTSLVGKTFPGPLDRLVGNEGTLWLDSPQEEAVFAYYRRLPLSGWIVVAEVPRSALDRPLYRSIEILAGLIAVLAAFALGSAWLIGRRPTVAHRSLIDAAAAVGSGRVPLPEPTSLHEVNLVAAALAAASLSVKHHAEKLTDANQNLERRVQQRTEDLTLRTMEIEAKNAFIATTLDTMKQGLIVIDADGRVPICNLQARRLLELPERLIDRHPSFEEIAAHTSDGTALAIVPLDRAPMRLPRPEAAAALSEQVTPNGRILEIRTAAIQPDRGFVQTFSDVTEERRNRRLLEEARVAAENANAAKSDFLANMSHEMRTPLNAILGYSDILLNGPQLETDIRRSVERIRGAGAALLNLVNDVLELGKIEAGVIDIHVAPFSLPELIEQAVSIIRPIAERKRLTVEVRSRVPMEGLRLGDRDRLRQVLLNLLGNAVKFTASGGVKLSIDEGASRGAVQTVRFSVTDTGIGIPVEDREKLFQRFQQLEPTINRRFEGAGLGLAISKHLVERMGGTIGFKSMTGKGSVFWFDLPLEPIRSEETPSSLETGSRAEPARILIAEDVVVNQELARELLERAGYAVDVVSTGKEAVDAVLAGQYDLVLMDISMPEMDGLTATRLIRCGPRKTSGVPIVACTAHVLPKQVEAIKEAGVNLYVFKPLQRDELYGAIDQLLGREKKNAPLDANPSAPDGVSALVALLGPSVLLSALDGFLVDLKAFDFDDAIADDDVARLAERAHAAIATASLLNLTELAKACRDFEDACYRNADVPDVHRRLKSALRSAVDDLDRLRNDLENQRKNGI